MTSDREELARLVGLAHDATKHIASEVSAVQLYRDAAAVAEQRLPGPLGVAVAGVLAIAAETRRVRGLNGILGEHHTMLSLAVAVLEILPDEEPTTKAVPS